jgi:LacI family transcriptional regulator
MEAARLLNYRPRGSRAPLPASDALALNGPVPDAAKDYIGFQFFSAEPQDTLSTNTFYLPMLSGAQSEASNLGMHLLLHETDRRADAVELPKMVLDRVVGGILLVGMAEPATLCAFASTVPRIVLLDHRDAESRFESVISDGFRGSQALTEHLLRIGHRRIAFFMSERNVPAFMDRKMGYEHALAAAGLHVEPGLVVTGDTKAAARHNLRALLVSPGRPTAVMASNDYYAFEVMSVAREIGLNLPVDLSITGFDDLPMCAHTHPALTTVRVEKEFMGRLAVRRLHARIHAAQAVLEEPCICSQVPVSVVLRDSTCSPRRS